MPSRFPHTQRAVIRHPSCQASPIVSTIEECQRFETGTGGISMLQYVLIAAFMFPMVAVAQTNMERYLLQERCGKRGDEIFAKEYGTHSKKTENGELRFNYESHYSERLNKCFFLEDTNSYSSVGGASTNWRLVRLFDANSNKEYGQLGLGVCYVSDKQCKSQEEFLELLKAYMEN
jgi:hypothetical protein